MASADDFPVLFTVEGSNRHEVLLAKTSYSVNDLKGMMENLIASSPNAAEFLHKYRSKESKDAIREITVRWGGHDKQLFPRETILTQENCEPVLRMMSVGVGRDVFDVKLQPQNAESAKQN